MNNFVAYKLLNFPKESWPPCKCIMDPYNATHHLIRSGEFTNITKKEDILEIFKNDFILNFNIYTRGSNYEKVKAEYNEKFKIFFENFVLEDFKKVIIESLNDYLRIPKNYHFWDINDFRILTTKTDENNKDIIKFHGRCRYDVECSILECGIQEEWKIYHNRPWFKGITIEDISKKYKNIDMEIYSEVEDYSEHLLLKDGNLTYGEDNLETHIYRNLEDAEYDGLDITEDELNWVIYIELPKWFKEIPGVRTRYNFEWNI